MKNKKVRDDNGLKTCHLSPQTTEEQQGKSHISQMSESERLIFVSGMRKEHGNYRNSKTRRLTRLSSQSRANGPKPLTGPVEGLLNELQPPALTPEQLIERIMEAEPPEIYLMKDMRRPLTEANVMMSLTNLADKELVHMISWAKKIPGVCRGFQGLL